MKVLCPTDFSRTSVNAIQWIGNYLHSNGGGTIVLFHGAGIQKRAGMFVDMTELLIGRAEDDLAQLEDALKGISDRVNIEKFITLRDAKSTIAKYAGKNDFDLIVVGTKGMTALKELTVGSVTSYLIDHSDVPVLAIPDEVDYFPLRSVILGVNDQPVKGEAVVSLLVEFLKTSGASLNMVHVKEEGEDPIEYDPSLDLFFEGVDYQYKSLTSSGSVVETLSDFAFTVEADMPVMIHQKRTWWQRLYRVSNTKSELFDLEKPLLVLPAVPKKVLVHG